MFDTLWQDIRYALRSLRRTPGFVCAAVLTLALGIGATTAVFSVLDAALFNPIPLPDPERLVMIYGTYERGNRNAISYPNYLDWRAQARSFERFAAFRGVRVTLTGEGLPEGLVGVRASSDFFAALGVQPLLGRAFDASEDQRGAPGVAVLGEGFWRRRFAADRGVIGQHITLDGRDHTVIGVMPDRARLFRDGVFLNDIFIPIGQIEDALFYDRGVQDGTLGLARLAQGVTMAQARAEFDTIALNLANAYPQANAGIGIAVVGIEDDLLGGRGSTFLALFGAVGFVLLIACTNVANLFLVRTARKSHEFSIRAALGAGHGRLIRQQLVESSLLAGVGGMSGVMLALYGTPVALKLLPTALPTLTQPRIDVRGLAFTFAVAILSGVLVGLMPALGAARAKTNATLARAPRRSALRRSRTQRVLVISEVALTLVLLTAAGLMGRSLVRLWDVDPGLNPEDVLVFSTGLSPERAATPDAIRRSMRQLGDRVVMAPGVRAASVEVGVLPFGAGHLGLGFWPASEPQPRANDMREAVSYLVGPEYFDVMRIPLLRGRNLTRQDDARAPRVVLIDQEFAQSVFPGGDAIGERIGLGFQDEPLEIVGIVGHVKHWGLDDDDAARVRAQLYLPYTQLPDAIASLVPRNLAVVLRSDAPLATLLPALRREIAAFDSTQTISNERLLIDAIAGSIATRRFSMFVLGVFAGVALLLSCIGIYGVVSYLTAQRTAEIGVRMAVGASPWAVLLLIVKEGYRLAILGIALGLLAAVSLTRLISSQLYEVTPTDPMTLGAVSLVLIATTLAACYMPARRAASLNPVEALRVD